MIEEDPSRKHFFTDIINSISRAKFSPVDDNYIYSKAYCKDPNYYYQRDITQLENEIKILKKHNEFSLKFIAKEKDYLNNLKLELANYF